MGVLEVLGKNKSLIWPSAIVLVAAVAGLTVDSVDNHRTTENQMKTCVASGKAWVRSGHSSYYECK